MTSHRNDLIESFQEFRERHSIIFSQSIQQLLLAVEQSLKGECQNQKKKRISHRQLVKEILAM